MAYLLRLCQDIGGDHTKQKDGSPDEAQASSVDGWSKIDRCGKSLNGHGYIPPEFPRESTVRISESCIPDS